MAVLKSIFGLTRLVDVGFQALPFGSIADDPYCIIDHASGALPEGADGLAYFLAVQVTLAIARVINFLTQRNITFESNTNHPVNQLGWAAHAEQLCKPKDLSRPDLGEG
jgi:hypothetical protein